MLKRIGSLLIAVLMGIACSMSAFANLSPAVELTNIRMTSSSAILEVGKTRQLAVQVSPAGAAADLTWRSSNTKVASVDDNGLVTGIERGTVTIYAAASNGMEAYCQFTVRSSDVDLIKMEMSLPKMTLRTGHTRELWVRFTPVDTTDRTLSWSSSNTAVAGVENNGTILAVSPGTATITATASGGLSASCIVTVTDGVLRTSGIDTGEEPPTTRKPAKAASSSTVVADNVVSAVKSAAKQTKKGVVGYADMRGETEISPTTLRASAEAASAADRQIRLRFLTTDAQGNILGSLTLDPQQAKARTDDFATTVSTTSLQSVSIAGKFERSFQNDLTVVDIAQSGNLGCTAALSVPSDLAKTDGSTLHFYTYDPQNNEYAALSVSNLSLSNGNIRFSTTTGGIILISDGALKTRSA